MLLVSSTKNLLILQTNDTWNICLTNTSALQETLESFRDTEFWYVDQGICAPDCDGSASFRRPAHRRDEKWWLPVPQLAHGGLREATRTQLEHKRDSANQILKAAMAINSNALAEMEVPDSYHDSLPKVQRGRDTVLCSFSSCTHVNF
jgi:hypothetical protein